MCFLEQTCDLTTWELKGNECEFSLFCTNLLLYGYVLKR
jgi:hypothetical protein